MGFFFPERVLSVYLGINVVGQGPGSVGANVEAILVKCWFKVCG